MKKVIVMIFAVAAIATSCKNTKNTETQNSAAQTATGPETKSQDDATSQSSAPEKILLQTTLQQVANLL
ncbi:hypothetical protein LDL59_00645 [Kaistella anthropi]|nr:hypothetical protein [Kaistella anthropi]